MLYNIHNSLSEHYKNNGHTLYIFGVHVTQIVYGYCKNTPPYNALALWFEPKWPRVFLLRPSNSCLLISYLYISVFIYICKYFYTHELIHTPSPILNSWHGFWTCVSTVQNLYLAGDDAGRARRNGEKIVLVSTSTCSHRFKLSRHYLWTISDYLQIEPSRLVGRARVCPPCGDGSLLAFAFSFLFRVVDFVSQPVPPLFPWMASLVPAFCPPLVADSSIFRQFSAPPKASANASIPPANTARSGDSPR